MYSVQEYCKTFQSIEDFEVLARTNDLIVKTRALYFLSRMRSLFAHMDKPTLSSYDDIILASQHPDLFTGKELDEASEAIESQAIDYNIHDAA